MMFAGIFVILELLLFDSTLVKACVNYKTNSIVDPSGYGNYTSVQQAIDAAPSYSQEKFTIFIKAGNYVEKVNIDASKINLVLKGEGAEMTQIQWNDTAGNSSTVESATVSVLPSDFIAMDISFHNTAFPAPGESGSQAVALRVSGDRSAFYRCAFYSLQDTLLDDDGCHYFKNCHIQGSVDFIFGNGKSLYEECTISSVAGMWPVPLTTGAIAAQGRPNAKDPSGFSFYMCNVTGTGRVFLGRAWGPYSRVVYSYVRMDNIITPPGWTDLDIPYRNETVFFAEYRCHGPGANRTDRVKYEKNLTYGTAKQFLSTDFINGSQWLPQEPCFP